MYRQICVRRRRPPTAAHLTHLISALGEDGDRFGDDLHAWGMSEINLPTRQDIHSTWHRIIYAHSPKAAFETNFPLPSTAAPIRRSPSRAFFSLSLPPIGARSTKDEAKRTQRAFTAVVDRDKKTDRARACMQK